MSNEQDMFWDEVSRDHEFEEQSFQHAAAKVAISDQAGWLLQSTSEGDYDNRLALVSASVDSKIAAVTSDPRVREAVLDSVREDFRAVLASRPKPKVAGSLWIYDIQTQVERGETSRNIDGIDVDLSTAKSILEAWNAERGIATISFDKVFNMAMRTVWASRKPQRRRTAATGDWEIGRPGDDFEYAEKVIYFPHPKGPNGQHEGLFLAAREKPFSNGVYLWTLTVIPQESSSRHGSASSLDQAIRDCEAAAQEFYVHFAVGSRQASRIDTLRGIVNNRQNSKIDGQTVDMQTANLLVQLHDALSVDNQAKFETMALDKVVNLAWGRVGGRRRQARLECSYEYKGQDASGNHEWLCTAHHWTERGGPPGNPPQFRCEEGFADDHFMASRRQASHEWFDTLRGISGSGVGNDVGGIWIEPTTASDIVSAIDGATQEDRDAILGMALGQVLNFYLDHLVFGPRAASKTSPVLRRVFASRRQAAGPNVPRINELLDSVTPEHELEPNDIPEEGGLGGAQPLSTDVEVAAAHGPVICGQCGLIWDDIRYPTPSGRCPFEYQHVDRVSSRRRQAQKTASSVVRRVEGQGPARQRVISALMAGKTPSLADHVQAGTVGSLQRQAANLPGAADHGRGPLLPMEQDPVRGVPPSRAKAPESPVQDDAPMTDPDAVPQGGTKPRTSTKHNRPPSRRQVLISRVAFANPDLSMGEVESVVNDIEATMGRGR